MKRALLIPLIVLVLVTMACSFGQPTPTAAPAEPTKSVVQAEKATEPPAEATPTDAIAAPTVVLATETVAPTETPSGPVTFTDTFDKVTSDWSDPIVVTTQASGREPYMKISAGDGKLRFAIDDKETYVYKLFLRGLEGATTVEADYTNKGALNTGIALVCKANKELNSWFEVRVSASDYNYHFYQYDKKRKEQDGKNPYIELAKGHMKAEEYFAAKPNHIVFSCTDTELTLDVNKGKKTASFTLDSKLDGNIVGIGVLSSDVVPGTIDFDTVTIR
jgi:hypothetical protein